MTKYHFVPVRKTGRNVEEKKCVVCSVNVSEFLEPRNPVRTSSVAQKGKCICFSCQSDFFESNL